MAELSATAKPPRAAIRAWFIGHTYYELIGHGLSAASCGRTFERL